MSMARLVPKYDPRAERAGNRIVVRQCRLRVRDAARITSPDLSRRGSGRYSARARGR